MHATDAEIAQHINSLLEELKWFRAHSVKIHLTPTAEGWKITFTVPEIPAPEKNHTPASLIADLPVQDRATAVHGGEEPKFTTLRPANPAS